MTNNATQPAPVLDALALVDCRYCDEGQHVPGVDSCDACRCHYCDNTGRHYPNLLSTHTSLCHCAHGDRLRAYRDEDQIADWEAGVR